MTIALYCPMKPPDHPVASGDREFARLIARIIDELGETAVLASRLRTWRAEPDAATFAALEADSVAEAERIVAAWRADGTRPAAWITYHLYHRAPDWIGPAVTRALDIPYVVVEASRAPKRASGPWAPGFAAADQALAAADAVVAMHAEDREGLAPVVAADRLFDLAPFIDTAPFAAAAPRPRPPGTPPRLLAAGMMRRGNKEACYRTLADALAALAATDWHLTIAGDGEAADDIRPLFDPARTTFLGAVDKARMPGVYADADLFVWPAVNEPFGLVFLEAQASGLPVVGGRSRGVPEVVADGMTGLLVEAGDAVAFADAVSALLGDAPRRTRMAEAARSHALARHDIAQATEALSAILQAATARRATGKAT
ncbi:glycosyltransferase family 4 protein [Amorphus sp. MBR-141]